MKGWTSLNWQRRQILLQMGRLALILPSKTSLVCIASCLITAQNRKLAKFHMKFGAVTIYIFCNFLLSASCLQRGCEQDQAAVDGIIFSPEGLCSVDVPQLNSRNSRDYLETRASVRADEQEAGLRERFNSQYLESKTSNRLEEGICSGIISDPVNSCGVALFQGRRPSQEDRAICLPQLCLPVSGSKNITVGLYAVFDGHGGQEASTFAAEAFHQHFANHFTQIMGTSEIASTTRRKTLLENGSSVSQGNWFQQSPFQGEGSSSAAFERSIMLDDPDRGRWHTDTPLGARRFKGDRSTRTSNLASLKDRPKRSYSAPAENSAKDDREQAGRHPGNRRRHYTREVLEYGVIIRQALEEALSRSIYSIDAMFSVEATQLGLFSGTTACIVLQVEDDLLVANLGDSKAFFCEPSEEVTCYPKLSRRRRKKLKRDCKARLRARELTRDHRPDRHDERQRIEGAGGFVTVYGGVARVNGKLAVSRSIGDVYFKRYGVIADPEFTGWLKIPKGQSFLTVASDGIFEKLSTQSVCEVLQAVHEKEDVFAVLGLEDSRVNAPIAMLPTGDGFSDQGKLLTRNGSPLFASEGMCAPEIELGNFSSAVVNSLQEMEEDQTKALSTEESHLVEALSLVQSMAQVVGETALELGTMDNVAVIVVSLRPLPPLLPGPNPLFEKTMDNSPRFVGDRENDVKRSNENTLWGFPDKASLVSPGPDADPSPLEGRTWSKSLNQNKSSAVMMHNRETSYCYELIETLPRHAIVPLTSIMEDDTFGKENEAVYRGAFLTTDVLYDSTGKDLVGAGGSLEVYREHLVCTPKHTHDKETKELCRRPDGLLHFLALIGSVPLDSQTLLPETDVFAGLADRPVFVPSSVRYHRYMLRKNFARGAFGEVWLAVRRTRSVPAGSHVNQFSNGSCSQEETKAQSQTSEQKRSVKHDNTTYVLKRILVERGNHVYLSGLREKYFGEIFLNASRARARAKKYPASFSCAAPNPYLPSRFRFCPWGFSNSWKLGGQNSGSRGKETLRGSGRSDFGPSIPEEGVEHIVRYIESFEVIGPRELWLVFKNEGKSLSSLLYSSERAEVEPDLDGGDGYFTVVQPSPWWHWLKTTSEGRKEMRSLLRELLLGVKACHSRNITHRDIKPENMIVSWRGSHAAGTPKADYPSKLKMRLIDFGSALDPFTVKHMYGPSGPSRLEQTNEYAPPEALLGKHWLHFHSHQAHVYDIWSVGVVMLELVLGTPHVFQISSRTRALLDRRLQGWNQSDKETAYMLRAFLEMCILLPGIPLQHQFHHNRDTVDNSEEQRLASWECTEQAFQEQIKQRDVLGIGMPDKWALRLVRRLLQWYPEDRISAVDALKHPYFHSRLKVD